MSKPVRWLMVFLFPLLSCSKEDNIVTPHELLSAHTWVSKSYVFEDEPTSTFYWDCKFGQDIPEYSYEAGDYGRLEVSMELSFTKDSLYNRILFVSRYLKCEGCSDYEFVEQTRGTLGAIYVAEEDRLWFGSRQDPLQYFYPIEFKSRKEIVIKEFFEVSNVVGNSECFFNDQPLRSNRQYGIDFVFKPK
ncbi:MAG: hypothetical protein ACMVP2_24335 [Imperialibacter sp.]|uniref:hypothetical protein n=1 Tax=Imperialibacter sp. TaxID=2038411 RepID=UPI0030DBF7F6